MDLSHNLVRSLGLWFFFFRGFKLHYLLFVHLNVLKNVVNLLLYFAVQDGIESFPERLDDEGDKPDLLFTDLNVFL